MMKEEMLLDCRNTLCVIPVTNVGIIIIRNNKKY